MIPNKTEVLNLKTRKTQVSMGYLSLIKVLKKKHTKIGPKGRPCAKRLNAHIFSLT
jgi:hypothetical protein